MPWCERESAELESAFEEASAARVRGHLSKRNGFSASYKDMLDDPLERASDERPLRSRLIKVQFRVMFRWHTASDPPVELGIEDDNIGIGTDEQ